MLENGHDEMRIDLADCASLDFSMIDDLAAKGHRHFLAFVHRFGEAGTIGQMDCLYSCWSTRRAEGFGEQALAALRDLVPVLGLAIKSAAQIDIGADARPRLSRTRRFGAGSARADIARASPSASMPCCGSPICADRPRSPRAFRPTRSSRFSTIMRRPRSTRSMMPAATCSNWSATACWRCSPIRTWRRPSAPRFGPSIVSGRT